MMKRRTAMKMMKMSVMMVRVGYSGVMLRMVMLQRWAVSTRC